MKNPITDIKIFIKNSINLFLGEQILDESDLTYNYKRKVIQSTILFSCNKKVRLKYKDKLKHFSNDRFNLLIHNNYMNFKLSSKIKQKFMSKFIKYIQTIPTNLTPIDYFLYYKIQDNLNNIKTKSFMNAQQTLLNFYGYSANIIFKNELTCKNQVLINFELDDFKFSYKINKFFKNKFFNDSFSPRYLNLLILSKKINTPSYPTKILKKLNTKNPFYVSAYVIARLNQLNPIPSSEINKIIDQETIDFSLLLAEILANYKDALNIYPLLDVLNKVCKNIYVNNFYNFDINKLVYKNNLISFLTKISQTTFFYY